MRNNQDSIYIRVKEFIDRNQLLNNEDTILLSLSAGKDSMALLDIMLRLRNEFNIEVAVFHLNHMMRGEESDEDERFIADIAQKNEITAFTQNYDFKSNRPGGVSFEEFARQKRYEILRTICKEKGFSKIVTAHNRDDNIETIIMRIFRGTGIHGLRGINAINGNIIRPLLFLSSKEIYSHLKENAISWREDSSNSDNKYLRNYIRNILLPQIYKNFPEPGEAIISLGETSREYTSIIDDLLTLKYGDIYKDEQGRVLLELDSLIQDKRIFKIVLAKAIRENFNEFVHRGMLDEIYKKAIIDKTHIALYESSNLYLEKTLTNKKNVIVISDNREYNYSESDWEYRIDLKDIHKKNVYIKEIKVDINLSIVNNKHFADKPDENNAIFISLDEDIAYIIIRNRRNADKIRLKSGSKKIKEIMINEKLDKKTKNLLPLLIINSKIAAFMPGLVIDMQNRVSKDFWVDSNSKKILAIHVN